MRGDIELVGEDGQVMGEGRVGEWFHIERSGTSHTLAIDAGEELVLQRMKPGGAHQLMVNEEALRMLLQ